MATISVSTAAALAGVDRRTIRRWVTSDGGVDLDTVLAHAGLDLEPEDRELVPAADAGDAEASADLALVLLERNLPDRAVYWLQRAADKGHADAMQQLGACYIAGRGVPKDEDQGIRWIAEAATLGHAIAKAQMAAIRGQR